MPDTILSCDWGTTNLRMCRVEIEAERVVDTASGGAGVKPVFDAWQRSGRDRIEHYSDALRPFVEALGRRRTDRALVISGMASSTIGMAELPYADVPFRLDGSDLEYRVLDSKLSGLRMLLLSGVRTADDVLRGEETEMIGLWRSVRFSHPTSLYVLPGTHSKHVEVVDGSITSFRTYMTGELFELLTRESILREGLRKEPFDEAAFERGVHASKDRPLLNGLFAVRTNKLFDDLDAGENYWYLSGLLVGSELGSVARSRPVCICGTSSLVNVYRAAAEALDMGADSVIVEENATERRAAMGHIVAYRRVFGEGPSATPRSPVRP